MNQSLIKKFLKPLSWFSLLFSLFPVQLGYHWWPQFSKVFGYRIDYLSPVIYLTDIIFVGFIISWFRSSQRVNIKTKFKSWIFLLIVIVVNILFSDSKVITLISWLRIFQIITITLFVAHHYAAVEKILNKILPLQIIFIGIVTASQSLLQRSLGGIFWWLGERDFTFFTPGIAKTSWCQLIPFDSDYLSHCDQFIRPYAMFSHPNSLAGYILICTLIIFLKYNEIKPVHKFISLLAKLSALFILLVTFSRTAWVAGIVSFLVGMVLPRQKLKFKYITCTGFLYFIICISLVFPFLIFSFEISHLIKASESYQVRQQLFYLAIDIFKEQPIWGSGLGTFIPQVVGHLSIPEIKLLQPVHHVLWLWISESGILGFIVLLVSLHKSRHLIEDKPNQERFNVIVLLTALVITASNDHYWLTLPQNRLLLGLTLGLIFNFNSWRNLPISRLRS